MAGALRAYPTPDRAETGETLGIERRGGLCRLRLGSLAD
jgi:hypothetical protein